MISVSRLKGNSMATLGAELLATLTRFDTPTIAMPWKSLSPNGGPAASPPVIYTV